MPNVTSVWDFSPGETLTAAKLDDVNCGIHVFSGTATRDAAYGGSGERALSEGEFAYLADTNTTQYYDGAAWQTVGGGMTVVKADTSFSGVSSITADNVFSSSYRFYTVKVIATASTAASVTFKMRVGGTSASTNYSSQLIQANGTSLVGVRASSATSADVASIGTVSSSFTLNLYNPAVADPTLYDAMNAYCASSLTTPLLISFLGNHSTATAYDGIEIIASNTITGNYSIYGWGK